MRVHMLYFGVVRERVARKSAEDLTLADDATVTDLVDHLNVAYPRLKDSWRHLKLAVNEDIADSGQALVDGDVVAVIPPVAGGSDRYCRVTEEPISVDDVLTAVSGPGHGGVVTFVGYVRGDSGGKPVSSLEYETYRPMALRNLDDIISRCEATATGVNVAVAHRVGRLDVGEIVVVIAAAAPHRAEAFHAARLCAELMKQETTIWKKEIGPDGEVWVDAPAELQVEL